MAALYGSEVKCVSVEWDFLQGLLVKNQPVPCLQALRKEKSRNAARSRRGKENFEFYELAKMLPLPGAITSQLDKASIVRLTISYLKMRDFANHGDPPWSLRADGPSPAGKASSRRNGSTLLTELFEQHLGGHILQSLDGFVFALNQEGKFLYISETVSIYLGLSQVELTGSSIFDYVHPGDHPEVAEQLGLKSPSDTSRSSRQKASSLVAASSSSGLSEASESDAASSRPAESDALERSFFIRLKSTLTKRGLHVKTSGYKVIHVTGRLRPRLPSFSHSHSILGRVMGLVALAHTLPPSTLSEVRIECHMFVFRVNMDLQIVYCESRISDYMDFCPSELVGKSCYRFIHGEDVEGIRQSHLDLLNKGQVVTQYYRWLQKNGGFVWIQSCATISVNVKNPSEKNMVWVNYILSKPEYKTTALDIFQLPGIPARQTEAPEAGPDFKENSLAKENSQGKLYSPNKPGSIAKAYPRSVVETVAQCHVAETDSSGPGRSYRDEEVSEDGGGTDTEGPPRKRIKLEFRPESPMQEAKDASLTSSEESDSGSESELGLLPQQKGPLVAKANGCKAGGRRSAGPSRPCTSEFASVIQTQKSSALKANPALSVKSEQVPGAKAAPWPCPAARKGSPYTVNKALSLEKPTLRQASSHLYVSIPDSVLTPPEMDNSTSKGPFGASPRTIPVASSSADTLSPPLSGSPCEERAASTPFTPLVYPADMEVLQRFHAGNVVVPLVHQLGSPHASTSGSQGLYATSTIRYAPADVTLAMPSNVLPPSHPINLMDISSAEAKTSRELMYHHLQRLNMVVPFGNSGGLAQISGGAFAATDALFSPLPFPVAGSGVHGTSALERKED
ncbi:neuronal PAS domain-containing protein 1 [Rhineura floridana]|uniref:neuronal PAS domain-containing protein 1 n=1 Tax=Rhineura floridana TaxID=261503 RepID=UPI002AC85A01|nr:neuronal PAS domain-containing protein 1 [Rhineura floridana]XP_061452765.1 neuronal PAS domain-containing protein 1 [Rhineura floridana]XP_061452766.1 neuronal PAS domain-containing protein 1 [Rhineura floridana]XP_061452767.1 neuronal PAS domain-containing protein 1 [Rhineura floridana]